MNCRMRSVALAKCRSVEDSSFRRKPESRKFNELGPGLRRDDGGFGAEVVFVVISRLSLALDPFGRQSLPIDFAVRVAR